jgi:hypothetical protein
MNLSTCAELLGRCNVSTALLLVQAFGIDSKIFSSKVFYLHHTLSGLARMKIRTLDMSILG